MEELNIFLTIKEWDKIISILKDRAHETNDFEFMELAIKIKTRIKYSDIFITRKSVLNQPSKMNNEKPEQIMDTETEFKKTIALDDVLNDVDQTIQMAKTLIRDELRKVRAIKPKQVDQVKIKLKDDQVKRLPSPYKKENNHPSDNKFIQKAY